MFVARHSIFSGPRKHSGNTFRCDICVSLRLLQYCLRLIKFICSKPIMLEPFLCTINVVASFILQSIWNLLPSAKCGLLKVAPEPI